MSKLHDIIRKFWLICRRAYKPDWKWHNFPNKKSFDKCFDERVNNSAWSVRTFYHGYPHIIKCSITSELYQIFSLGDYQKFDAVLNGWLSENCVGEYRYDFQRTSFWQGEELMDELGGGDHLFVAFMDEQDAVMFSLKWC